MVKNQITFACCLSLLVYEFRFATAENHFDLHSTKFLVEVRDNENNHKCFGTVISSKMILAPASCVEADFADDVLIMTENQENLTSIENLPDSYYNRLLSWYEDQCNQVSLNASTIAECNDKMEYLKELKTLRGDIPTIPESSVRTVTKVVSHLLYTKEDEIFNLAVLVLRVPLAMDDEPSSQLYLNLGFKISNDIEYHLASHDLGSMYNRTFEVIKKGECQQVFPTYSNVTHFCVKSLHLSNDLELVIGKSILNGPKMYGLVLDTAIQDNDEILLVLNIAKFVSFTQAVEDGQDMNSLKLEVQSMSWAFVQSILKRMMFV